jgi:large subunit ribosomal protein L2
MFLKIFRKNTSAARHKVMVDATFLRNLKHNHIRALFFNFRGKSGHNNYGRYIFKSKSHSSKDLSSLNNYMLYKNSSLAIIIYIYKYISRSALSCLLKYITGSYSIINLVSGCFIGSIIQNINIQSHMSRQLTLGSCLLGIHVEESQIYSCVGYSKLKRPLYAIAAGTYCTVKSKVPENGVIFIELPSGALKKFSTSILLIFGRNSNETYSSQTLSSYGQSRIYGRRPHVRGAAMNPIDHPNGGKTNSKKSAKTP